MKKIVAFRGLLLFATLSINATEESPTPPDNLIKTTIKSAAWGTGSALVGYSLRRTITFFLADHSLDFPSIVTPTPKSSWALGALGLAGAALLANKAYQKRELSFEEFLPIEDSSKKQCAGKAVKTGITNAVAYGILMGLLDQNFKEATLCIATGGLLELVRK